MTELFKRDIELMTPEALFDALGHAEKGSARVGALWNQEEIAGTFRADQDSLRSDGKYEMGDAESILAAFVGISESGLAAHVLETKGDDLLVVHNRDSGATLLTGTSSPSAEQLAALETNGISYVNRTEPDAVEQINLALDKVLEGVSDIERSNMPIERTLACAFMISGIAKENFPHSEIENANYVSYTGASRERDRPLYRENLLSVLLDDGGMLEKTHPLFIRSLPEDLDLDRSGKEVFHYPPYEAQKEAAAAIDADQGQWAGADGADGHLIREMLDAERTNSDSHASRVLAERAASEEKGQSNGIG